MHADSLILQSLNHLLLIWRNCSGMRSSSNSASPVVHDKLEASLRDLSRTGDVQTCKAADGLKELAKELKPLLAFLQSSPQAAQLWPKVEELVTKEREMQEKVMLKHSTVVDSYEKKSMGKENENKIASLHQKLASLKQEVDELLEVLDEI
ncbi:dolichyl-diphosphooligosaccharide--protein glycosyltransferase subunit 1A-like [Macadamia integrifolia]|uniref:dolichyl-diphosphooligosaccharide--protein glycosyltransferase subunit 1A-like n=1 Tax=Macadamia integrifolia TaxID=60698 RepID=UPI001C4F9C1A|nr:dolichyl-diphosphooligosaccharide--protein glycosyltransferase subunit 1A-like [Macadamia integrifolia]XP_042507791.1 dolichyl-diphosphooligosaccharide--protein glycosyltransferase subunit 1A-like [Macadamia integrifolia]